MGIGPHYEKNKEERRSEGVNWTGLGQINMKERIIVKGKRENKTNDMKQ